MPTEPQWFILALQMGSFGVLCVLVLYHLPKVMKLLREDYHAARKEHADERKEWRESSERTHRTLARGILRIAQALDRLSNGGWRARPPRPNQPGSQQPPPGAV